MLQSAITGFCPVYFTLEKINNEDGGGDVNTTGSSA
jgi:hypothetical protein